MNRMNRSVVAGSALLALAISWQGSARADVPPDLLTSGKAVYSQGKEELIARHFFNDKKEGFYVDVGAWRWNVASTTAYLDLNLGWRGLAIDALPHLAPDWAANRPKAKYLNYLVTDHSGTVESFYAAGPLSSTERDHVKEFAGAEEADVREIKVPTITLNELLDKHAVKKIDFLSMDIEESEPAALAGFDIERFKPELVCIEMSPSVREKIHAYFGAHGYERIDEYAKHDTVNWYYRPKAAPRPLPQPAPPKPNG
jgi:FkbM family methyltransferase